MQNTHINEDILSDLENLIDSNIDSTLENISKIDTPYSPEPLNSLNKSEEVKYTPILIDSQDTEIIPDEIKEEKKYIKKSSKFITGILFLFKYMATSSLIFALLLVTTNYSAYINVAKSYIFQEELENKSAGLINSVKASNIKEKIKTEVVEKNRAIEKENTTPVGRNSIKNLVALSNKNELDLNIEITPYENRIVIPKIGKNIPLLDITNRKISGENELNDIFMKELENGVIRYPGSAKPGKDGNAFIFGHSSNFPWIKGEYNDVFSLLDKVQYEDEIIVYYGQKKYTYKIREKKVITPGDISILKRNNDKSEITLMTCWPIGTTLNRLIVTGELIEE
ncbi:sortase [Candidatus Gracilibacteria bacterium 28_42_T64]|nr:sortase [Candidatus Gracilibacteria bacterium 28_42_T64]